MLTNYKAVFFDVGGTLLRAHPSVGEVYTRHARPFGFTGAAEDLDRAFRAQWDRMGGIESLGTGRGPEVERRFWRELVGAVFDRFGGLSDLDAYFEIIYRAFEQGESWKVFEDVEESGILEHLNCRNVVLGVISNWDSRLEATLENTGLARHFQFILASTVVGSAKPHTEIFAEALRRSGVAASEACHVGDEIRTDMDGARNAGIDSILIDRNGRHGNLFSPTVRSFTELV
ncbi:MAG: haloacid dehalogenase [Nitrospinae bacterium CG11_big_fil_rev_8_21_14_0_20_56_8]|nr:MAG: haloacid dehalogenase [Nitrospinae bacterium CG11_big_fil_rev_8_21_14_0_20_56_8]